MTEQKSFNVTSRIKSLELISFNVEQIDSAVVIDKNKITFEIGVGIQVHDADKMITIINPIEIFADESKKLPLGSVQVKGEFIVENLDELKQGNSIPIQVIAIFFGVVVSSTRGMLRVLSKGTSFESAIIPIINPTALLANLGEQMNK